MYFQIKLSDIKLDLLRDEIDQLTLADIVAIARGGGNLKSKQVFIDPQDLLNPRVKEAMDVLSTSLGMDIIINEDDLNMNDNNQVVMQIHPKFNRNVTTIKKAIVQVAGVVAYALVTEKWNLKDLLTQIDILNNQYPISEYSPNHILRVATQIAKRAAEAMMVGNGFTVKVGRSKVKLDNLPEAGEEKWEQAFRLAMHIRQLNWRRPGTNQLIFTDPPFWKAFKNQSGLFTPDQVVFMLDKAKEYLATAVRTYLQDRRRLSPGAVVPKHIENATSSFYSREGAFGKSIQEYMENEWLNISEQDKSRIRTSLNSIQNIFNG